MKPRSDDWTDTAPVKVRVSRDLAATPDEVFAALADHESWPKWFTALERVERIGAQHDGVGSQRRATLAKGRVTIDEEFVVWEPGTSWGFTVTAATGPFKTLESLNERVDIQALGHESVRVSYLMAMQPRRGAGLLWNKIARRGLQKNLRGALSGLGRHIEARRGA